MKITNSNGSPSEMAQNITNSIQDFASGKVSEEEGLAAIESAISQAISKGLMSPQDVVSISEEALGMGQEETQNFSMKTLGSMQAEKAAAQPQGVMADVAEESKYAFPSGKVSPGLQNMKKLDTGMEAHEELFAELRDMTKEEAQEALAEAANKLKDESVIRQTLENAKNTPSRDTGIQQESSSSQQGSSEAPSADSSSSSSTDADPVITTGGGSSSDAEAVITTGGGSSDGGEVTITTDSSTIDSSGSAGTENVEVTSSKRPRRPSAPSLDITV